MIFNKNKYIKKKFLFKNKPKLATIQENELLFHYKKYNEYNQINIIDKLYNIYMSILKLLYKDI